MNRIIRSAIALFALTTASLGCGLAPGPHDNAPLASLRGTITQASVSTPEQLHVALVWSTFDTNDHELKSAQEVGVRTEFPVRFQIDVNALPPESAMNRFPADEAMRHGIDPSSFRFAVGAVLVYEDTNGSGALDLLPLDATSFIDRPLGAAQPWIFYVEGTPPPADALDGVALAAGFNLVSMDVCDDGTDFCSPKAKSIPISTELEIALSADPKLAELLCQYSGASSEGSDGPGPMGMSGGGGGPSPTDPPYTPPPSGSTITCADDNRSYTYETCGQASLSLCAPTACAGSSQALQPDQPAPAGWPCPL